jgi:hypothetical protein
MKPKRVECDNCQNFIQPKLNGCGMITILAKCKLGKKVMFRHYIIGPDLHYYGYARYCNEYKQNEDYGT